ncbi:helix-turn-helix domain-containing protein [Streptomyces lavendulae]|uniref:helix-turn-helix domain-containing protein n=1 Tax=Streptomyces lavendulae TaxID=1914 RepID=UPI0033C17809
MPDGAPIPLSDDEIAEIARLHAEGLGRNEIARRVGRGTRTVSVCCARLGLIFTNTATEAATAARNTQLAEKRSILADALTDDALRLTAAMWEPAKVYNIGGKDNTYTEQLVPEPPAADKRALMTAATAAAAQSLRLVPAANDNGVEQGVSMVGQLLTGLTAIHRAHQSAEDPHEGDGDAP